MYSKSLVLILSIISILIVPNLLTESTILFAQNFNNSEFLKTSENSKIDLSTQTERLYKDVPNYSECIFSMNWVRIHYGDGTYDNIYERISYLAKGEFINDTTFMGTINSVFFKGDLTVLGSVRLDFDAGLNTVLEAGFSFTETWRYFRYDSSIYTTKVKLNLEARDIPEEWSSGGVQNYRVSKEATCNHIRNLDWEMIGIYPKKITKYECDSSSEIEIFLEGEAEPPILYDEITIADITPHPDDGFPEVSESATVDFTNIKIDYDLQTKEKATIYLRVFANDDIGQMLGEKKKDITKPTEGTQGTFTFPMLTARNIAEDDITLTVVAYLVPENSTDMSIASDPMRYEIKDKIEIEATNPASSEPLTAKKIETIQADIKYELVTSSNATIELQLKDSKGYVVKKSTPIDVTKTNNSLQTSITLTVPDHSNKLFLTAKMISEKGRETVSKPAVEFEVNRIRFLSVEPPKEEALDVGQVEQFNANIEYYLAAQTQNGAVNLDVIHTNGSVMSPSGTVNNEKLNLSPGYGTLNLMTNALIEKDNPRPMLLATLSDGQPITTDTLTYHVLLKGLVYIKGSNPKIGLWRAEVKVVDKSGVLVDDDETNVDGEYRLSLEPGDYKYKATPDPEDNRIRTEEEDEFKITKDSGKLPDIPMGVVNQSPEVQQQAIDLMEAGQGKFGPLNFYSSWPLVEKMQQVYQFANSYPPPPESTDERLYRLMLAGMVTNTIFADAEVLSKDLSNDFVDLIVQITFLGKLKDKLMNKLNKILETRGINWVYLKLGPKFSKWAKKWGGKAGDWARFFAMKIFDLKFNSNDSNKNTESRFLMTILRYFTKLISQKAESLTKDGFKKVVAFDLLTYYGYKTSPIIQNYINLASSFSPKDADIRIDDLAVRVKLNNAVQSTIRLRNSASQSGASAWVKKLGEKKKEIDRLTQSMNAWKDFPTPKWVLHMVMNGGMKILKTFTHYVNVITGLNREWNVGITTGHLFFNLPQRLESATKTAFQIESSVSRSNLGHMGTGTRVTPYKNAELDDHIRTHLSAVSTDFNAKLTSLKNLIENNQIIDAVNYAYDEFMPSDDELRKSIEMSEAPIMGAAGATITADSSFYDQYKTFSDSSVAFGGIMLNFYMYLHGFFISSAAVESLEDTGFVSLKKEMLSIIDDIMLRNNNLTNQIQSSIQFIENSGTLPQTVLITNVQFSSPGDTLSYIAFSPQDFTISATVRNISDQPASHLNISLASFQESSQIALKSNQSSKIDNLNGGESQTFSWNCQFNGAIKEDLIPIEVILESDSQNVFIPGSYFVNITMIDDQDTDGDLMPNSYENQYGLNPNSKDAYSDLDKDNLLNFSEYFLETDPNNNDTDGDTYLDGEEMVSGSDPLDPESIPLSIIEAVDVKMDTYAALPGDEFVVPIKIGDLMGHQIYSADITLSYDSTVVKANSVSTNNTIAAGWGTPTFNFSNYGQINIAMAGTSALPGSGTLALVSFDVVGALGDTCQIHFSECILNEGNPPSSTQDGFFRVGDESTGITKTESPLPQDFNLYQNYPNPFNPETHISFEIPNSSNVILEIYDLIGQKVRTLISGHQNTGIHTIVWDSRNDLGELVPSGIYVYRLKTDQVVLSKKLMLLR